MAMKVGELFTEVEVRQDKFNTGLGKMQSALANKLGVSSAAVGAATAGIAAVGAAAAAAAVKGVSEFTKFEKQLREVFTLIPDASEQMKNQMTEDIREFSVEMGVATDEAVPALYQAISAGVPKDNVFNFLETAQKAAVGGVTDLETAVDGLTSVVNAYGRETIGATEASDIMFTAVKQGKTTFGEMSSSLNQVIPIASSMGVEFGNVAAALSTMTAQGTPTAQATVQIRQALSELGKEGSDAYDAFKKVAGQAFPDFIAEGGNLQEAMQLMKQAADENGTSIQNLFGNIRAGQAAMQLTGAGAEKFQENLNGMDESAGATQQAYDEMEKSLSRSFDKIKSAVQDVWLEIGTELAPIMKDLADWIIANMPAIKRIVGTTFELIAEVVGLVGPVIGDTLEAFITFFDVVARIVDAVINPFETVKEFLKKFSLYDIGRDIIQGLINGIKEKLMTPVRLIQNMANDVKNAAKNILGIQSPSKEFQKIGMNVTEGFREGIKQTERLAANQVSNMMQGTINQPQMAASGGGPQVIRLNVTQNISDKQTAEYANDDLVAKLQGRGVPGGYR